MNIYYKSNIVALSNPTTDYNSYNRQNNIIKYAIVCGTAYISGLHTSSEVVMNIFSVLDKHLPKSNKYYMIFNRHTEKLSYATSN